MMIYCVLAPILGIGVGFLISNFCLYLWTIEAVIEVHRWGFIAVAVTITILVLKYLLESHMLADRLAATRYENMRFELDEKKKKLDIRQYSLNALYAKHRLYQGKIEQELIAKVELIADLRRKLISVENLISEIEQIKKSPTNIASNDGRANRQQKKIEKIIQNAESIREGVIK